MKLVEYIFLKCPSVLLNLAVWERTNCDENKIDIFFGRCNFFFSCRLSIMVKRPPSCMSKTQELSQKIDFDSASITGENSPEFDDVDDFQDEFINIVMPLIKNGPDDSQSFRGCYNNVHFW